MNERMYFVYGWRILDMEFMVPSCSKAAFSGIDIVQRGMVGGARKISNMGSVR